MLVGRNLNEFCYESFGHFIDDTLNTEKIILIV